MYRPTKEQINSSIEQKDYVEETDITFSEDNQQEEFFTVMCFDGYGMAANEKKAVEVTYPKLSELSEQDKIDIMEYRGVTVKKFIEGYGEIHYGDVMLLKGKIIQK